MYGKVISFWFCVVLDACPFLLCYGSALPFCSVFPLEPVSKGTDFSFDCANFNVKMSEVIPKLHLSS